MSENFLDFSMEKTLAEEGEVVACSSGISMYPMLRHRKDMVVVETVKRELKKYDVPLYRLNSGKLVLHRILEVRPDLYVIRGDNLLHKEYVRPEQIIGVLKAFYRGGKFVDCATNKKYRLYIYCNRYTFYLRYVWKRFIRPILSKLKHLILDKK